MIRLFFDFRLYSEAAGEGDHGWRVLHRVFEWRVYWVHWGVSGAIFCLTFLRFWRVDEDNTPSKKNPIYRPTTTELSLETIRNSTMTYITLTRL